MVLPPPAAAGDLAVVTWEEADDPHALVAAMVRDAAGGRLGAAARIAVSDDLPARHLLRLGDRLGDARLELASPVLRELRIVKDADEIALLTAAAHAADRVVAHISGGRLVGRTEADVAREVRERLIAEGHDDAHFAIVGSGPNSASPHHEASERVIAAGEPIVLDIGGTIDGYGSDITRTLWVTGGDPAKGPDERFRHLFGVLHGAQAAATRAVRPGVAPEAVDAAARDPIEAEGFGEAFFHRTGHGIGLEGHEDPYIIAGNREPLREGMAFSVEPGIYLVGEYGARIEDIVVCGRTARSRSTRLFHEHPRRRRLEPGRAEKGKLRPPRRPRFVATSWGIIGRRACPMRPARAFRVRMTTSTRRRPGVASLARTAGSGSGDR